MASIVANCLRKISFWKMGECLNSENKISCNRLEKLENIFFRIFRILLWDDPYLTSFCILCLNIVFVLIIYFDLKFYVILFIAILLMTFEQVWVEQIFINKKSNKEIQNLSKENMSNIRGDMTSNNLSSICFRKSQEMVKTLFERGKYFRKSQPGMFCTVTCVFFLFLSVIGRSISSVVSLYLLFMLLLLLPGIIIHFLPPYVISSLSNFICSNRKEENLRTEEVESFLPNPNQEALEVLRLAGEVQLSTKDEEENSTDLLLEQISGHTSDSESINSKFSFYPESSFMPSPENSIDFFELDLPSTDHTEKLEFEDLDSNEINFQSKHFNGESSDEDEFTKGLKLITQGNISNTLKTNDQIASVQTLNLEKPTMSSTKGIVTLNKAKEDKKSEKETSSDTDSFEMISEEDV